MKEPMNGQEQATKAMRVKLFFWGGGVWGGLNVFFGGVFLGIFLIQPTNGAAQDKALRGSQLAT